MQQIDASNSIFSLASDLVNHTSKDIFLTGKAGTGKTTFLKYIKEACPKQLAVVAPTGVAAINAGGVTIHSFFQLPFAPFLPESRGFTGNQEEVADKHSLLGQLRLNGERRKILQELELLIIDEISMVRCDVLDAIDLVLRHVRFRQWERFGGVQVLFIGDLYQLPPVVKDQEWNLLREQYRSPYFFDSHVMRNNPPLYVEFNRIYRQSEEEFIDLLNRVRNNEMTGESLRQLHQRYRPEFSGENAEGYILLTTHNAKAKEVNTGALGKLESKMFTYKAEVQGDFPPSAFPVDELLQLKVGAQVLFLKNDTDKAKRYFNGKIGEVTELLEDKIIVRCKNDPAPIEVAREKWENIRYQLDPTTRQMKEEALGSFLQYPLRLAWAITIHKSQGLSFEKAIIDAGGAFAPGQVYVALSRCTNLEGMVLRSQLLPNSFSSDARILSFTRSALTPELLQQELMAEKKAYQEKILSSLFEFSGPLNGLKSLEQYVEQHHSSFDGEPLTWLQDLLTRVEALDATGEKFRGQLSRLFSSGGTVEENQELQDRIGKAVNWFTTGIQPLTERLLQSPALTDSTLHAKEYNELLREVHVQLTRQQFLLLGFRGTVDVAGFHRRKKMFVVPPFGVNAYAGASAKKPALAHPFLYFQLRKVRDEICSKKNLPIYLVAGSKSLEEMTTYLPQTMEELEQISGFGKAKLQSYGEDFLSIIRAYADEQGLPSGIADKAPAKKKKKSAGPPKTDTRSESFRLYKEGRNVREIAGERNLTVQTIEGHLAHYVQQGLIRIDELVSREKLVLIEPLARDHAGGSIQRIKEKLDSSISFGEIRLVLASLDQSGHRPI